MAHNQRIQHSVPEMKSYEQAVSDQVGGAVLPAAAPNFGTREGMVAALQDIFRDPDSKPIDQIRALDKIAELRGLKVLSDHRNLRRLPPEDLRGIVHDIVIPALEQYGVRKAKAPRGD